ncbi:MAG: histidinol-phosphatase [Anaerolineae bacterium]
MTELTSLRTLLDFAMDVAWQAGQLTLAYFQTDVDVEWKGDNSPVTVADRGAEKLMRRLIEKRFPSHAIIGEEFGEATRDSKYRWIIDPIDGTRSFVRGVPLYGVLVGLEIDGDAVLGVVYFPALREMVAAARGEGCRWNGRLVHVSNTVSLDQALLLYTDAFDFVKYGYAQVWERLQTATHTQRSWGDCYGHCLVATGRAEVMLDPVLSVWDAAPLLPILQEAGGTFTDWSGTPTIYGANGMSTNGLVFEPILQILSL